MGLMLVCCSYKQHGFGRVFFGNTFYLVLLFIVPVAIGIGWFTYADFVRSFNVFSEAAIFKDSSFDYSGPWALRISSTVLKTFWTRTIETNAAGMLGVVVIFVALIWADKYIRNILLVTMILFALPLLLFTRAHYLFDYYDVANVVFLVAALAIATVAWQCTKIVGRTGISVLLVLAIIICNYRNFYVGYGRHLGKELNVNTTRNLLIGDLIRRYTPEESGVVIFGVLSQDREAPGFWSSEIAYYSQRKALTRKEGSSRLGEDPAAFLGGKRVGAIVFCLPRDMNTDRYERIMSRYAIDNRPHLFKVDKCYVWLPLAHSVTLPNGTMMFPTQSFRN